MANGGFTQRRREQLHLLYLVTPILIEIMALTSQFFIVSWFVCFFLIKLARLI